MAGIYALLALIGGLMALIATSHQGVLPALLAAFLFSNLLPLLAAIVFTPTVQPVTIRKRR